MYRYGSRNPMAQSTHDPSNGPLPSVLTRGRIVPQPVVSPFASLL
jgi:hypothetical protein